MKYFMGSKRFCGGLSYSLRAFLPRMDTNESKREHPVIIELSEKGEKLTLTEATDLYLAGKLTGDYVVDKGAKQ